MRAGQVVMAALLGQLVHPRGELIGRPDLGAVQFESHEGHESRQHTGIVGTLVAQHPQPSVVGDDLGRVARAPNELETAERDAQLVLRGGALPCVGEAG